MITIHQTPCAPHPSKRMVSRGELATQTGVLWQRKADGIFATVEAMINGTRTVLAGELMRKRSGAFLTALDRQRLHDHGGEFFLAFDLASWGSVSMLGEPLSVRWAALRTMAASFKQCPGLYLIENSQNPDFVEKCLADGAEGVVGKDLDQPYGEMACFKQGEIFVCEVYRKDGTQSASIRDAVTRADRGRVKLGGGKIDQCREGSIIRVEALGKTDSGKLRQPAPAREWLVSY